MRARELAGRGLQDVLHPADLSPATMRDALERLLARPRPSFSNADFGGTERTADLLAALAGGARDGRAFDAVRRRISEQR
jgi:predicted glycosyltransferase